MKSIILKGRNSKNRPNNRFNRNESNNPSYKTVKHPSYNEKPFTKANLRELLNELIVESHESEDASIVSENAIDDNESTLLVNSTISSKLNPRDIRKLLYTPIKGNMHPSHSSIKQIACEMDTTINGKTCREVGKHIVYYLSKVSHSSVDSLVDRGTNGGAEGNDIRVIVKHPDRTANFRSIDNHEIASIPLKLQVGSH